MTSYYTTFRRPGGELSNPHYDVGGKVLTEWLLADYIKIPPSPWLSRHLKVWVAVKKENKKLGDFRARLEKQDAYTLYRPVKKTLRVRPLFGK